jgi:hypothetical protein
MMKGFSLLEFLVATSFFLTILLSGYQAFDSQSKMFQEMLGRTRTEEESNYRLLVLQTLLQRSSEKFKMDRMLAGAACFFEDLNFGATKREDAFSFAIPQGDPIRFEWNGSGVDIPTSMKISGKKLLLLGGSDSNGKYEWNYARVLQIVSTPGAQQLTLQPLLKKDPIQYGSLIEVEVDGVAFQQEQLFWVSGTGQYEPFFEPVEEFHYEWKSPRLRVMWKAGLNDAFLTLMP